MSIHAALHHVSHYQYDRPVQLGPQVIRLRPAPHTRSRIVSYALHITPVPHFVHWQQDPFANHLARVVFPDKVTEFKVTVDVVVEIAVYNPFDFFVAPEAEQFPFRYSEALTEALAPYLVQLPATPLFAAYAARIDRTPRPTVEFVVQLNQQVQRDIRYLSRMEPGVHTPEETLARGCGSCRDSAWLLVQLLRHLGLAARFASGYLIQLAPDVKSLDGPSGTDVDFTDLHAWCEVYLPGAGWIGLDATSGLLASEGHIPLACSPSPSSAAPIEGGVEAAEVAFAHTMHVARIHESPRVTHPYTDAQWHAVLALGDAVDARLHAQDVRLTVASQPTFVATSDRDAPEWNSEALGPSKRAYASALAHRLRDTCAPGSVVHWGRSPCSPSAPAPRWAASLYWRTDGQPIWRNPALFADAHGTHAACADANAHTFITHLAARLGVAPTLAQPAYEDRDYYQWCAQRLPLHAQHDDAIARAQLQRVLSQGLERPVGYVLPLQPGPHPSGGWGSGRWWVRSERLLLVPGDAPMGERLPLDAQPWRPPEDTLHGQSTGTSPHTALCVQVRAPHHADGTASSPPAAGSGLYVFMPQLAHADDYLALLTAVEATAEALGLHLTLEGHPPPPDARLQQLHVTPAPGVIAAHLPPAAHWRELVARTEVLYEAAFHTRLSADKFMADGRHTGTGGGNPIALGGATPADSPFLRRPDVLASVLLYWHNHPSLSYLFSGQCMGPSSPFPRMDEVRCDHAYELELALQTLAPHGHAHGAGLTPACIDRALHSSLADASGHTRCTEFGIDQLAPPGIPTAQLGLLALRAWETPPHARMGLVQQLLLRALIAHFWYTPYRATATRWGTSLHDRFMLPHFVQQDFHDVLADLQHAGFALEAAWFAPHFAFRFPPIGEIRRMGMTVTLRHALEPWRVTLDASACSGAAQRLDAPLQRLEVRVQGLNESRYVVTVNGRVLPLSPTGVEGEFVAGVRYEAWHSPASRPESMDAHAPLVLDVVDTWTQRSIGGCQYHIARPSGCRDTTFPVNAYEAESRRLARFFDSGHTPGLSAALPANLHAVDSREFPLTLDLRRPA